MSTKSKYLRNRRKSNFFMNLFDLVFESKKEGGQEIRDYLFFRNYIGLKGNYVEYHARKCRIRVEPAYREKREKRDGTLHHITLVTKKELQSAVDKLVKEDPVKYSSLSVTHLASSFIQNISESVRNEWAAKGIGKVVENTNEGNTNEAYFIVVEWKSFNEWRKKRGFEEKDLHITLGFKEKDIHDVKKDTSTLI